VPSELVEAHVQVGIAFGAWWWYASTSSGHAQWTGRQVLLAGEQINVEASIAAMCLITGYELLAG